MMDRQTQAFGSVLDSIVVSLADRVRVRRQSGPRTRVKHGRITMREAEAVNDAWLFAIQGETPLNTFVTVHWGHAPPIDGAHPVERNGRLRDGLKAWLYRHAPGLPFVWIEVREKTPGSHGDHVHLFVHVPDDCREGFTAAVFRLVSNQSSSVSPTACDVRPVGAAWWDRRAYALKAGTDDVRERYMTSEQRRRKGWGPGQGIIDGPRTRVSHSIGQTARAAAEGVGTFTDMKATA